MGIFQPRNVYLNIHGVFFWNDTNIGSNKNIVANGDFSAIISLQVAFRKT